MRLTFSICLFCVLQSFAIGTYSQSVRLSINQKDVSVESVLQLIEDKTDYYFMYSALVVDVKRTVDVEATNKLVPEILDDIFKGTDTSYKIDGRIVALSKNGEISQVTQQSKSVSGKVTDSSGTPLPGVSVVVKGTTTGTITDTNGNYSINNVPENATLVFSFVGMTMQEVTTTGKSTINAILIEESIGIDEVVAIGYGTQKKAAISGSIVSVAPKKLQESGVSNLTNAIAGITPGVIVRQTQGQVGKDDAEIYIRGKGTLGNTGALIIIDGIPDRGNFSRLNPDDIESFTVLKDASAAIYGARSANGVILITTKRGKNGKPNFNANVSTTMSQPTVLLQAIDSWKWAEFEKEQIDNMNQGWVPNFNDQQIQLMKDQSKPYEYANTNWGKITQKTWTPSTNSSFSVSGGSETLNYYLSSQYQKQNSLFIGDWPFEQYQFRANFDAKLSKRLSMGLDFYNRRENRKYSKFETIDDVNHGGNTWNSNFVSTWPWLIGRFPNGYLGKGSQPSGGSNPLGMLDPANGSNTDKTNLLNSKLSLKWDVTDGLSITAYGAFDTSDDSRKNFQGIFDEYLYDSSTDTYSKAADATKASLQQEKWNYSTNTYNIKIDYKKSFGVHNVDAFVAYEQSKRRSDMISATRKNFGGNSLQELFAGGSTTMTNDGRSFADGRINYFGRINYDYAGKYLTTFSLRQDGSQNFPTNNRFGTFPGISLGWRLSEEPFFKNSKIVNNLKLRGSWGQLGNDNIAPFQYYGAYEFKVQGEYGAVAGYDFGSGEQPGFFESVIANPNITWEVATTSNIGLEGILFNNSLSFDFDYFMSKRKNILIQRNASVPDYSGLKLPDENLGIVDNKGFEIQFSYHKNLAKDLVFVIGANMSYAKNKVVYFDEPASILPYQKYEGNSIDSYLLYKAIGIYQNQAEIDASVHGANIGPGSLKLLDANNDGIINDLDKVRLDNNSIPSTQYGINLGISYKNWEVSALITGQAGGYRLMNSYSIGPWFDNRWQKEGDNFYPRAETTSGQGSYNYSSSFFLESTDFTRLKNLSITYNMPKHIVEMLKLDNLRIYLRGNDIAILRHKLNELYSDPETDWYNGTPMRSWQLGLDLNF